MAAAADALRISTGIFSEGLEHLHAGRLSEALANFEASLSINEKYLQPLSLESITCYQQIASVHDRLGNVPVAKAYYERARTHLADPRAIATGERGVLPRKKRAELQKQVQQRLELLDRASASAPRVGAGVPLDDLRRLYASLLRSGDAHLASSDLDGARLAYEQALALCRTHHSTFGAAAPAPAPPRRVGARAAPEAAAAAQSRRARAAPPPTRRPRRRPPPPPPPPPSPTPPPWRSRTFSHASRRCTRGAGRRRWRRRT